MVPNVSVGYCFLIQPRTLDTASKDLALTRECVITHRYNPLALLLKISALGSKSDICFESKKLRAGFKYRQISHILTKLKIVCVLGVEWLPHPLFTFSYVPDHGASAHTLAAYCTLCADTLSQALMNGWSAQYVSAIGKSSAFWEG